MTRALWITLALLIAIPASAQVWKRSCGETTVTGITGGQFACFDPTANTDDSPILAVGGCERTNISSHSDKDGDGTVCTVDYTIQACPDDAGTLDDATKRDNACALVQGTSTLSGNSQESAIAAGPYLRVQASETGTNSADCRIIAHCAMRSN